MDTMATPPVAKFLFSVTDYHRLGSAGIFNEDDPIELLNGEIYIMSPIGVPHANMVTRLNRLFLKNRNVEAQVAIQNPIALNEFSEPEPDIALIRPDYDLGGTSHPAPGDVLLLIEVADSSLHYDKELKLPAYARAGIQEVWIIVLPLRVVQIYREPLATGEYALVRSIRENESFAPGAFPDLTIDFHDLGWQE